MTIVFVAMGDVRAKGRDSERKQNLKELEKALELYHSSNGSYPSTGLSWWAEDPSYGGHTLSGVNGWIPNLAPTYIKILPHDPLSGQDRSAFDPTCTSTETYYFYISDGKDYKVLAYCTIETLTPLGEAFADPIWNPVSFSVYTPGAANW